jgi:hypothetical protein
MAIRRLRIAYVADTAYHERVDHKYVQEMLSKPWHRHHADYVFIATLLPTMLNRLQRQSAITAMVIVSSESPFRG